MNTEYNQLPQENLFAEEDLFYLKEAGPGKRFANFLIDLIIAQYALGFIVGSLITLILVKVFPDTAYTIYAERNSATFLLFTYLVAFINSFIYYSFCEKVFKGQTLGKLITGTRAVREDGTPLRWKDACLRSVIRFVPFEVFSLWVSYGFWHDKWSKTMVIRK